MLKLDTMALLLTVVDSGSFTAAARQSGLPKSTVSSRIAELEQYLGVRLLQRTTRKLSPTAAGQVYIEHCRTMVDAAHAADAAVSLLRDAPAGSLRLTVPEASGTVLLPALLAAFRRRYPAIRLECLVTDAHLDLVADRIDLALRTGALADSTFVSRRVGPVRRVLVAAPVYLAQAGAPHVPAALAQHALLMHDSATHWPLQAGNEIVRVAAGHPAQTANSLCYLLGAACAGEGVAMLPWFLARAAVERGELAVVLPDYPPTFNHYYAVYPSRSHPSAALRALLDFLDQYNLAARLA